MTDEPRIEFPCDYPIKVICEAGPDVADKIIAIVRTHDSTISAAQVTSQPSKNGNYVSLRFNLWATGKPHLEKLFEDLKKNKSVRMVL